MLTAIGNRAALCLCLFCWRSGDWLRNSLNSKRMKDSSVRKCFYFGNPKIYLRYMWHDGKHSKNFEKKNWFWHRRWGNYWENYCKSITAANNSSQWMMNGGKRYSSKHFMHVAHLQSTQVISYNINISYPSNSSFNTLECHKNTTSHVTTHLSEAFAVDFKHLLPQNRRCSQPLATGQPCASASSAGAAATGWGTASTASRWKMHPWGNAFTSGTQKFI